MSLVWREIKTVEAVRSMLAITLLLEISDKVKHTKYAT
jgi:hypothetical protein